MPSSVRWWDVGLAIWGDPVPRREVEARGARAGPAERGRRRDHPDVWLPSLSGPPGLPGPPGPSGMGRSDGLPGAGVALVLVEAGVAHTAVGHELAIDLGGAQWYLAPGDRFTAAAATYVVTPLTDGLTGGAPLSPR